jgi:large subunit ribosomal protein L35Ae
MDAMILSFRRGRHTQKTNQFLLQVEGSDSRKKASGYIGKRVVWSSTPKARDKKPKKIFGTITACHGNSGVLRVRFSKGLPGDAIRSLAQVLEPSS